MIIQILLPLANAFTPAILHASTDSDTKEFKTRKYKLASGETAASVARHFNLSVNQLYRLNDNRTFPNGFDSLRPGDEIQVPERPLLSLPTLMADSANHETGTKLETNDANTRLANAASQAGTFFSGSPGSDEAKNLARSALSGAATTQVQQWLSRTGTARVRLDVDNKLSLKNSSLEILHPLYDKNDWMLFSQGGIHRADDRSQINLGLGARHFSGESMVGMNTFLDHDLSHYHTRLGVGLEYWRDYLKLGANGYIRLSGWKESKNVEDYDERAANGWDVRAEAWLPSYPQLGGKLTYEQYYGNEVALSGRNDRQRNPQAVTAGITYTPVPLLTLSAERNQGKSGSGDTILSMQLTVNPDMAWQQQINPDAVAAMRKLSGSRYDLVERNNNIVLEYRKREVIRLRLPERIEGRSQQIISVIPDVQSKYGFRSIEWDDADLRAAGGKLTGQGMQWQLTLPAWQAGKVNAWLVTAVAHDAKDNTSSRAEMQVVLTAPVISAADSSLTASPDSIPADGQSQSTVTVTLKDTAGSPMKGVAEQISLTGMLTAVASSGHSGTSVPPYLGKLTEISDGVYTTTLTAGTEAGTYNVVAQIADVSIGTVAVTLQDTAVDLSQSTLDADKTSLVADGRDRAILTFSLNAQNPTVRSEKEHVEFFIDSLVTNGITLGTVQEIQPGTFTTTLSGNKPLKQVPVGVKYRGNDTGKRLLFDLSTGIQIVVTGNAVVGETLQANPVCMGTCQSLTYQWQIEDTDGSGVFVDIVGANSSAYIPVTGDQKRKIRVVVTE